MDLLEAIKARHSVRSYLDKPIEGDIKDELVSFIDEVNKESGLHIQLILNEPKAFGSFTAHYGMFKGVTDYIALVGKDDKALDEKCGYYGEKIVLKAQQLGLNTCWVALTYSKVKDAYVVDEGEKLCLVIAIGYGETQGHQHKSKTREKVMKINSEPPLWFINGIDAALLAPTAVNQQKFTFTLNGNKVSAKAGLGFNNKVDLGIVKYHFEIGAGKDNFEWNI
ncbi:MAG: nitroreductase [Erysipelotrichales bacterium]|nr:nitroreductase [Erysipelotrichales bacterium]